MMVQKRHFCDEEFHNLTSKHPKQVEDNDQLVSFSEIAPLDVSSLHSSAAGEHGPMGSDSGTDVGMRFSSDLDSPPVTTHNGLETTNPWSGYSSWAISNTAEVAFHWDPPVDVSSPPSYAFPDCTISSHDHDKDAYSSWSHCSTKTVPIGPLHQADIPECEIEPCNKESTLTTVIEDCFDAGTCIIPMPDLEIMVDETGFGTHCSCHDGGSIRCIRQHIVEARERLRNNLGLDKFADLGFFDMGENVAQRWSEAEEQMFHEVVLSNPVSLGKNFWESLSMAFPSRPAKELVCYYFNVFMLRKRAEQNRCNRMDADSDNDEWEGRGDIYCVDEARTTEEDGDSVVESPGTFVLNKGIANVAVDGEKNCVSREEVDDFAQMFCCGNSVGNPEPLPFVMGNIAWCESNYKDVHDDSCKSSDTELSSQGMFEKGESDSPWLSCEEYLTRPCDTIDGDASLPTHPRE